MREGRAVAIDTIYSGPGRLPDVDVVVLVDVLCDTTVLVTAASQGRQTFAAASAPAALCRARTLNEPIVATSEMDNWRPGLEMKDSPAALACRSDHRPLVLACATGATLAAHAPVWPDVYLVCFRNLAATARHLALHHRQVLVLDAGDDADVRCEDEMAAGRLALCLADSGFTPVGYGTRDTMSRWGKAKATLAAWGRSADELRRRRRQDDVEFVLSHVDDLEVACTYSDGRVQVEQAAEPTGLSIIA